MWNVIYRSMQLVCRLVPLHPHPLLNQNKKMSRLVKQGLDVNMPIWPQFFKRWIALFTG